MIFHDVIGDIHGHSDELEVLLQKLGYLKLNGVYSHSVGSKKKITLILVLSFGLSRRGNDNDF